MGRPREFDMDEALDRALKVFWEKGYEGASLTDLTEAMGINRPSLYAAFGDKQSLFIKVMERYTTGPAAYVLQALKKPTSREAFEALLQGAVKLQAGGDGPPGCLMVQAALVCGDEAKCIQEAVAKQRLAAEMAIRKRLEAALAEGDLPPGTSCPDLARYIATVIRGLAVQAAGGATRRELQQVAKIALRAWPT